MRWLIIPVLFAALLVAGGGWLVYRQGITLPSADTPVLQFAVEPELDPLEVLLIEQLAVSARTIVCARGVCETEEPAPAAEAVTDGTWWYFYEEQVNDRRETVQTLLRRRSSTGEREVVMAETPLTAPRGLLMSPDNTRLAFFLDNKTDPKEQLTELWVFNVQQPGVRLIAEKLYVPDIRSRVRWNLAGTHLWYLADNGAKDAATDELEFVVADVDNPGAAVVLAGTNWEPFFSRFDRVPSDIRLPEQSFATTTTSFLGQEALVIITPTGSDQTTVRGTIPLVQWLRDGSLLYAVQDRDGFTFWLFVNGTHRFVARRPGQLQSAHTDSSNTYLSFAVRLAPESAPRVLSLHIDSGRIGEEALLNQTRAPLHVVGVRQLEREERSEQAVITALDDTELAAFLDQHLTAIAGEKVRPLRFVTTDSTNTVFVEFLTEQDLHRRVLVTVRDAIHAEWIIRARYEPVNTTWRKIEGGGLADPSPVRLYEWEASVGRWILKPQS